jgi:hypothetical protein
MLFDRLFWWATAERAIKTGVQATIALFAAGATILDIDVRQGLAVVATAALLSVLGSLASARLGPHHGPSLTSEAVDESTA